MTSIVWLDVRGKIRPSFDHSSLDTEKGAVKVNSALKGGAAEKAGIKAGDVLVSIDGEKLTDLKRATSRLADAPIGEEVTFVVRRSGQERTVGVKGE